MHGMTMAAVLQVAILASSQTDYQTAYDRAEAAGRPLLVLVGSDQSTEYQDLKLDTLPEMIRSGGLENIVFTEVEMDAKPDLTRQLLRGDTLPQLVLYTPVTKKTWRRTHISGSISEREIQTFLMRQISKGLEVAAKERYKPTTVRSTTITPVPVTTMPSSSYSFPSSGSS